MGGVDLMDGLMGRYHIRAKTRDPMIRIFYHLVDMAATNAYILHRRMYSENLSSDNKNEKILQLPQFREAIAAGLVGYQDRRDVGRPACSPSQLNLIHGQRCKHPIGDIRFDKYDHFPIWLSRDQGKKKCKYCKTSETQCFCEKCQLHLCCSSSKNCFFAYHH